MSEPEKTAETTPDPPILELVPGPALAWLCDCGKMGLLPDPRALQSWMGGKRIRLKCQHCGRDIVLVHPEPPLVVTPDQIREAQSQRPPSGLVV